MDRKCNRCGIYEVLHTKMSHDFIPEEKYAFDENDRPIAIKEGESK